MKIRKSSCFLLRFRNEPVLDIAAMLRGAVSIALEDRLMATSAITGRTTPVSEEELRLLCSIPVTTWSDVEDLLSRCSVDRRVADSLLREGLLICDSDDQELRLWRAREERLLRSGLHLDSYELHLRCRSRGLRAPEILRKGDSPEPTLSPEPDLAEHYRVLEWQAARLEATRQAFGAPPAHFCDWPTTVKQIDLDVPDRSEELFTTLLSRKTTRLFEREREMASADLSTVLYYTFGCQGYAQLMPGLTGLRKTSPSGGALHPIEVFPLIQGVAGVPPGAYHYNVKRHGIDLITPLDLPKANRLATVFMCAQSYFASAHAIFIMVARFQRHYWKYREAPKSYRVLSMDAGHLGQTFYLTCAQLGLGAFFTGAVNEIDVEEFFGLDPLEYGVLAAVGCGPPRNDGQDLGLTVLPYIPRQTEA